MIKFILRFFPIVYLVLFSSMLKASENKNIHMLLDKGVVIIETFPEKAPETVNRIIELANEGFYDGLTFHRVITGFMAQGGDPEGNGIDISSFVFDNNGNNKITATTVNNSTYQVILSIYNIKSIDII